VSGYIAVGLGGASPRTLANVFAGLALVAPGALASVLSVACAALTAAALTAALTTTGAHADEAAAAAQIFAFEYPNSKTVSTPEQISAAARSFRASPEYQEGLHICVNSMVTAIIEHTTTDANTAAYCDAFATGYAEAQVADKRAQAAGLLDEAMKGKK
jgi:hypothetical protein